MENVMQTQRIGDWLPNDRKQIVQWINRLIKEHVIPRRMSIKNGEPSQEKYMMKHKEVREFKELLDTDPKLHLLAQQMIDQAYGYSEKDPTGKPEIQDYNTMLHLIDIIMDLAPEYVQPGSEGRGLIGFPINAVLDWCMGTHAGYAFFLEKRVNECFEKILKRWCEFLSSEASTYVLNNSDIGWLCDAAREELMLDKFEYDENKEHYGFKSWNDFFTRKFKPGERPVAGIDDDAVIISACESAPYKISKNVQKNEKFWLKGQPYSIEYMLDHDEHVDEFIGGTVYQAFLSAAKYHRWHSPVSGKIVKAYNVPGTYYSEVNTFPYDDAGPNNSQGYITHVAARAVILIESDNPDIGLMAFIAVGMAEVSSCIISVKEGDRVKKGDEIGYFQFGGSTHCLIFRKGVNLAFRQEAFPAEDFNNSTFIEINSKLAVILKD